MLTRVGQVWEASSIMNGERIVVVVDSRKARSTYNTCVVHRVYHLTGAKLGRLLEWTERDGEWEVDRSMKRLV